MTPAGRPEIGHPINIRLGDELLAAVDAKAARLGVSRAELIRMLLTDQLANGAAGHIVELEKRIAALENPPCCKGGPQWGHAWDCPTLP